jgi:hypothetical protein
MRCSRSRFNQYQKRIPAPIILVLIGIAFGAQAGDYAHLAVVKPATSCEALGKTDVTHVADTSATIQSAALIDTVKGQFCKVVGTIEPRDGCRR